MRHKINSKLRRSFEAHEVLPNKNREGNVLFFKVKKAVLPPSDYDDHYMGDRDNTTADLKIRHNMTTQHKTRILISCLHDSSVRSPPHSCSARGSKNSSSEEEYHTEA